MVVIPKDKYQRRNIVVLISGKAGAGKTTVAEAMLKALPVTTPAIVSSFAVGIKASAQLAGWDRKKDKRGRRFLQQLGNAGREYDKNLWVELTMKIAHQMSNPIALDYLFIDDWRFPNEYQWFAKRDMYSVHRVRVHRAESELLNPTDTDISEVALPDGMVKDIYDYHLVNKNMDLAELNAHSRFILQQIIDKEFSYEDNWTDIKPEP